MFVVSPNVTSPPSVRALAKARASVSVEETTPPFNVTMPTPKAASSPASAVPAPRVKPPTKVLAPESVSVPAVVFVALPPARVAETVPASKAKVVAVSVPFSIVPPVSVAVPTVSARVPRSKVPPLTVKEPASARWSPAPESRRLPALTVVPPVWVVSEVSVSVPAPALTREPTPSIAPPSV